MTKKPLSELLTNTQPVATAKDGTLNAGEDAPESMESVLARLAQLQAENERLKGEFQRATDAARASAVLLSQYQEVHAGQTEPDKHGNVEDLWEYTIDLALNGGEGVKINGRTFYHGQTYTLTTNQLRMVKDMVYRTHLHEQMVFGHTKDNFYKQQNNRSITNGRVVNMS